MVRNSITGNATMLQHEIDDKEIKYNQLLREIELKSFHIESVENILKRKDEEIARLNEVLFIYKNNSRNDVTENNLKNLEDGESKQTSLSLNNFTQNVSVSNFVNRNNAENNFSEDKRNVSQYEQNLDEEKNNLIGDKNYMSESGNRFMINEEKERELQKLIRNYNLDKSENSIYQEKNESFTNRTNSKKVPGKIYSIKKI